MAQALVEAKLLLEGDRVKLCDKEVDVLNVELGNGLVFLTLRRSDGSEWRKPLFRKNPVWITNPQRDIMSEPTLRLRDILNG